MRRRKVCSCLARRSWRGRARNIAVCVVVQARRLRPNRGRARRWREVPVSLIRSHQSTMSIGIIILATASCPRAKYRFRPNWNGRVRESVSPGILSSRIRLGRLRARVHGSGQRLEWKRGILNRRKDGVYQQKRVTEIKQRLIKPKQNFLRVGLDVQIRLQALS